MRQTAAGATAFRLAEMSQDSAHFSLQPELWAAMMAQSSVPSDVKIHLITDNMTSKLAFTESAHKPNRSETRVAHRAHMDRDAQFRNHHPDSSRATATHQYSHTKEHSLSACLNRCIDVLLNRAQHTAPKPSTLGTPSSPTAHQERPTRNRRPPPLPPTRTATQNPRGTPAITITGRSMAHGPATMRRGAQPGRRTGQEEAFAPSPAHGMLDREPG